MSAIAQFLLKKHSRVDDGPIRATGVQVAETVRGIRPYEPASSLEKIAAKPDVQAFKLDWNESTVPPSPRVIDAITAFLGNSHNLNWYPELYSNELRKHLSAYTGLRADEILVTNGSDDALELICKTYLNPGEEVLVPSPTYTHFLVFAGAQGGKTVRIYNRDPFQRSLRRLLRGITYLTKLIYLVNPNNPTGVLYPANEIRRILEAAPWALLIVDEAYFEFCGESVCHLVRQYPNLVVTRTFSKSFGIAGLRIGYLMAARETLKNLNRLFNPKSVNVLGQVAATTALQDREYLDDYVAQVTQSKKALVDYFKSIGFVAHSTPANYILIRAGDTKTFCQLLEEQGIYVRDRDGIAQLRGHVRMSVGTLDQTREIIRRIDTILHRFPL